MIEIGKVYFFDTSSGFLYHPGAHSAVGILSSASLLAAFTGNK